MKRPLEETSVVELTAEARPLTPGHEIASDRMLIRTRFGIGSGEPLGFPTRMGSISALVIGMYGGDGAGLGVGVGAEAKPFAISCLRAPITRSIALAATRSTFD